MNDVPVLSAAKNGREFVLSDFRRVITHKFKHTPYMQTKSVLEQLESDFPKIFQGVAASQFRHPGDLSISAGLQHVVA